MAESRVNRTGVAAAGAWRDWVDPRRVGWLRLMLVFVPAALIAWLVSMNPVVTAHARHAVAGWHAAWKIEAPTCGVRAYGLLFRANDCDTDAQ